MGPKISMIEMKKEHVGRIYEYQRYFNIRASKVRL